MQTQPQMGSTAAQPQPPGRGAMHAATTAVTPTGYTITDLGAIAGDSSSVVGQGSLAIGKALNNPGQATGDSSSPTAAIATLFSNGKATNINTLGASVSIGNSINDLGQVAGEETLPNDPCSCFHAFVYSNGAMKNIENTSLFPNGTEAYGINKSGQVVGAGFPSGAGYPFHAFLYTAGKMTDLNPFNGYQSIARSINDSGQIIGSSTGDGTKANPGSATWLYSNGTITSLSATNNGISINNNGMIAGQNSSGHGAVYSNGTWTDLGTLAGASGTAADSVNLSGQAVGSATLAGTGSYHPFRPPKTVAVIFTSSGPVDLNTLIPTNSGFSLTSARWINDSGQIACNATTSTGAKRAVLLTPK